MTIASLKITSLNSAITNGVINSELSHPLLVQETSVAPNRFGDIVAQVRTLGLKILLTGTDPEMKHHTGGVAMLCPKNQVMQRVTPVTEDYKKVQKGGRLDITALPLPSGSLLTIANIYGWTNGSCNAEAAQRTNHLVSIALKELQHAPQGPKVLLGDLNGNISDCETLQNAIDNGELIDFGSSAMYANPTSSPTCFTTNGQPTQRDYILGNRTFQQMATSFEVLHIDEVPTHRLLRLHFTCTLKQQYVTRSAKSPPVTAFLCDALKRKLGLNDQQCIPRQDYLKAVASLKNSIEQELLAQQHQLEKSIASKCTSTLWITFCQAFTKAASSTLAQLEPDDDNNDGLETTTSHKRLSNIGRHTTKRVPHHPKIQMDDGTPKVVPTNTTLATIGSQLRRLEACLRSTSAHIQKPSEETHKHALSNWDSFLAKHDTSLKCPSTMPDPFGVKHEVSPALSLRVQLLIKAHKSMQTSLSAHERSHRYKAFKDNMLTSPHLRASYKHINVKPSSTIFGLRIADGSFSTSNEDIDKTLIDEWAKVYAGNFEDQAKEAANYLMAYQPFLCHNPAFNMPAITAQGLYDITQHISPSASGLDNFHPEDLRLLPLQAFEWLTAMYKMIEQGESWPDDSLTIGAHLLPKDTSDATNPLAYRILLITPSIYRLWARYRLSQLDEWASLWLPDCSFAGTIGMAAEDAWYGTALQLEKAMVDKRKLVGGSLDLFKCFDQVPRPLLYCLLLHAGFPRGVLLGYLNFHEKAAIRHILGDSLGEHHFHRCGIPQGCPFSMLFITMMLAPWARQMAQYQVQPRCLADDMLITAVGPKALTMFTRAFHETMAHMKSMGSELSAHKSLLFSTDSEARDWMRHYVWPLPQQAIKVVSNMRDLGASINTANKVSTTQSQVRLKAGMQALTRINTLPHSHHVKELLVNSVANNRALYGCEVYDVDESMLSQFTSKLATTLVSSVQHKRGTMILAVSRFGVMLNPYVQVLYRRINKTRTMLNKWPNHIPTFQHILNHYTSINHVGIYQSNEALDLLTPAPPPSRANRINWKSPQVAHGPVSLLLQDLHYLAATLDPSTFTIKSAITYDWNPLHVSHQVVKSNIAQLAQHSMTHYGHSTRSALQATTNIDYDLCARSLRSLSPALAPIARASCTLALTEAHQLHKFDSNNQNMCQFCGEQEPDPAHVSWKCAHNTIAEARNQAFEDATWDKLKDTLIECQEIMPLSLKYGIPPRMQVHPHYPIWHDPP